MAKRNIMELTSMLSSPNANTRYEACYQLRDMETLTPDVIVLLNKLTSDPEISIAQAALRALEIHHAVQKSERDKELEEIILVTTPSIEGRRISEYLGIVSAEVVLGTGFFSELNAGIADMLGVRSNIIQEKLQEAKDETLCELRIKANELHANAILGLDLDYSVLTNNMLMVISNGTAVRLEELIK